MKTRIPVNNLGTIGFVSDVLPHDLPPEAWSEASNVRMIEGAVKKMEGEVKVYGAPTAAPYGLFAITNPSDNFWIYFSLGKAYAVNSTLTHTDVTKAATTYGGNADIGWTGGFLGGVGIFNNGVDKPQAWLPCALATALVDLANWPGTFTAMAIRPLKTFLVAMDITEGGTRKPYNVLWSHTADPGTVPTSWDVTDETVDTGEVTLGDSDGYVLDMLPMRSVGIVYKEDQTWAMAFVGGADVFDFIRLFDGGMISRNCAAGYYFKGPKHAVFGPDDLYIHDGSSAESIADERTRRFLFNRISRQHFKRCFTVANPRKSEIWFCYPTGGASFANEALVWNYKGNRFCGTRLLSGVRCAATGIVNSEGTATVWNNDPAVWDSDDTVWDEQFGISRKDLVLGDVTNTLLLKTDSANILNTTLMTSYVKRSGLALAGFDRNGKAKSDAGVVKMCSELWPRFEATSGTVVNIYVGVHDKPDEAVTWSGPFPFTVGEDEFICPWVSGRYLAVWFQTATDVDWKLYGYDLVVSPIGGRLGR